MSDMSNETSSPSLGDAPAMWNHLRIWIGVAGVVAVVVGVLILVWPGRTAEVVAAIVAVYAIASGLVYVGVGLIARGPTVWRRLWHVVLGVIFVVAGVVALFNLQATTATLAALLGIMIGITWIAEGIVSLTTLGDAASKVWSGLFAAISIVAGAMLLFGPLWGAATLWWLMGFALVVLGIFQIVRAFHISPDTTRA